MKKIGVTGAAGFVGSHLCERLLAEDYQVVGVDDMSYGAMAKLEPFLPHRGFKFPARDLLPCFTFLGRLNLGLVTRLHPDP